MANYYLLSATGEDHPGFVASLTKILFEKKCNLEDSAMMRLGSEFAMFIIFTSSRKLSVDNFRATLKGKDLRLDVKVISARQARFTPAKRETYVVRMHGNDAPGIVYNLTRCLAENAFNITDLSTHRMTAGTSPGYVVLLEGELEKPADLDALRSDLKHLADSLRVNVSIEMVDSQSL